jgi:hypothetical protein
MPSGCHPSWGGLSRGAALSLGIRVVGTGLLYGLYGVLSTGRRLVLAGTGGLTVLGMAVVLLVPTGSWPLAALLLGIALAPSMRLFSFEAEVPRALNRYGEAFAPNYVLRPLAIGGGTGG